MRGHRGRTIRERRMTLDRRQVDDKHYEGVEKRRNERRTHNAEETHESGLHVHAKDSDKTKSVEK